MNNRSTFQLGIAASVKGQNELKALQAELKALGTTGGQSAATMTGGFAGLSDRVRRTWSDMRSGMEALQAPVIAIAGGIAAINAAMSSVREGAANMNVAAAFKSLHDDSEALKNNMMKATGFTVDDERLMAMVNSYKLAGKEIDGLVAVLPAAQRIAAATMKDTAQVAEELAMGLKFGRERTLEQYVGVIDTAKAYDDFAKQLGKTAKELDEVEKKMAITAVASERLRDVTADIDLDPVGEAVQKANAQLNEFVDSMKVGAVYTAMAAKGAVDFWTLQTADGEEVVRLHRERLQALYDARVNAQEEIRDLKAASELRKDLNVLMAPFVTMGEAAAENAERWYKATEESLRVARIQKEIEDAALGRLQDKASDAQKIYDLEKQRIELETKAADGLNVAESLRLATIVEQLRLLGQRTALTSAEKNAMQEQARLDAAGQRGRERAQVIMAEAFGWLKKAAEEADRVLDKQGARGGGGGGGARAQGISADEARITELIAAEQDERTKNGLEFYKQMQDIGRKFRAGEITDELATHEQRMAQIQFANEERKRIAGEEAAALAEKQKREEEANRAILAAERARADEERKMHQERLERMQQMNNEINNAAVSLQANLGAMSANGWEFAGNISQAVGAAQQAAQALNEAIVMGSQASKGAWGSAISASGRFTAAFIKDVQAQAIIQGLFETAASIASFARYDYYGGAAHALASNLYFYAAARGGGGGGGKGASGGGGGGAGGSGPPNQWKGKSVSDSQGQTAAAAAGPASITYNVYGYVGNERQLGAELVRLQNAAAGTARLDSRVTGAGNWRAGA